MQNNNFISKKIKAGIANASLVLMATTSLMFFSGCGKKTEAVITDDGVDITEAATQYPTVAESKEEKFSYKDLSVTGIKCFMSEEDAKKVKGEPSAVYDSDSERVYSYNDLTLIFTKLDSSNHEVGKSEEGQYKLTAAASVSDKDKFARGLKVGVDADKVIETYYRDTNYLNNKYVSKDKSTVMGNFLYGNLTLDDLDNVKTKDQIMYGMINYSGYQSKELADNYIIEYTYFDSTYKDGMASTKDDFAQIAFDVDRDNKVTAIRWYYYPEE